MIDNLDGKLYILGFLDGEITKQNGREGKIVVGLFTFRLVCFLLKLYRLLCIDFSSTSLFFPYIH